MAKKVETGDEENLKKIVKSAGELMLNYGGFKVVIKDGKKFNWVDTFDWFFKFGYQVYVEKDDDGICIVAEPVS